MPPAPLSVPGILHCKIVHGPESALSTFQQGRCLPPEASPRNAKCKVQSAKYSKYTSANPHPHATNNKTPLKKTRTQPKARSANRADAEGETRITARLVSTSRSVLKEHPPTLHAAKKKADQPKARSANRADAEGKVRIKARAVSTARSVFKEPPSARARSRRARSGPVDVYFLYTRAGRNAAPRLRSRVLTSRRGRLRQAALSLPSIRAKRHHR